MIVCVIHSVMSDFLKPHGLWPARLPCPWISPGKNTGVGCHFLLQGIVLNQELNPHLLDLLHWLGQAGAGGVCSLSLAWGLSTWEANTEHR